MQFSWKPSVCYHTFKKIVMLANYPKNLSKLCSFLSLLEPGLGKKGEFINWTRVWDFGIYLTTTTARKHLRRTSANICSIAFAKNASKSSVKRKQINEPIAKRIFNNANIRDIWLRMVHLVDNFPRIMFQFGCMKSDFVLLSCCIPSFTRSN